MIIDLASPDRSCEDSGGGGGGRGKGEGRDTSRYQMPSPNVLIYYFPAGAGGKKVVLYLPAKRNAVRHSLFVEYSCGEAHAFSFQHAHVRSRCACETIEQP